jgi:hypothetical protein
MARQSENFSSRMATHCQMDDFNPRLVQAVHCTETAGPVKIPINSPAPIANHFAAPNYWVAGWNKNDPAKSGAVPGTY